MSVAAKSEWVSTHDVYILLRSNNNILSHRCLHSSPSERLQGGGWYTFFGGTPSLEATVGEVLEGAVSAPLTPALCRLSTHLVRRRLATTPTTGVLQFPTDGQVTNNILIKIATHKYYTCMQTLFCCSLSVSSESLYHALAQSPPVVRLAATDR